jgi:transposase
MRPKGSSAELEQRRRDAIAMLEQGMTLTEVADALGTSSVSVWRWRKAAAVGPQGLVAKPVPGRPPKLDRAKRQEIAGLLRKGPAHYGFSTELWTLARIAEVIESHFGVSYHPSQIWRILMSLGWTCQKPDCRARERDEQAIARWRRVDWPRIKKRGGNRPKRAVSR